MRITFDTEDGLTLEAELRLPEGTALGSAVICHAHPRFGGSKDYPLLWALRIELARRGFAVVAFNFRGVMGSEGRYGGGVDEVLDVRAAVSRGLQESDGPAFVCGWSFGAHVALRACVEDERVARLALIGLPLAGADPALPALPGGERLGGFDRPALLLAGEDDPYCPTSELTALSELLPHSRVEVVPGADHYLHQHERDAAAIVGRFAAELIEDQ